MDYNDILPIPTIPSDTEYAEYHKQIQQQIIEGLGIPKELFNDSNTNYSSARIDIPNNIRKADDLIKKQMR